MMWTMWGDNETQKSVQSATKREWKRLDGAGFSVVEISAIFFHFFLAVGWQCPFNRMWKDSVTICQDVGEGSEKKVFLSLRFQYHFSGIVLLLSNCLFMSEPRLFLAPTSKWAQLHCASYIVYLIRCWAHRNGSMTQAEETVVVCCRCQIYSDTSFMLRKQKAPMLRKGILWSPATMNWCNHFNYSVSSLRPSILLITINAKLVRRMEFYSLYPVFSWNFHHFR